jgi:hypothetical protein
MTNWIAYLTREARIAVLSHRQDARDNPDQHRGCLWCEDGRFSHWLTDCRNFYGADTASAVEALYDRAYGAGYSGIM